jgi:hypothetical protein
MTASKPACDDFVVEHVEAKRLEVDLNADLAQLILNDDSTFARIACVRVWSN